MRYAVLTVVAALAVLIPTGCSSHWIDQGVGLPTKTDDNAALIEQQIRQEVCSNVQYITYDSTLDSDETRRQIDELNRVLFEVYRCSIK